MRSRRYDGCVLTPIQVSGGHFKATRHRVFRPPADQLHEERLSLVLFNSSVGDLRMTPAMGMCLCSLSSPIHGVDSCLESPLIQREGCIEKQGVYKEFKAIIDQGVPVSWSCLVILET